ncbi:hypothetical protein J3R82DRAFT_10298 [Butyriboletus roseoflavus]|nr:hypothetical protein J3R82DRAFT_10298 [Butyriboletus roseoflavus]
MSHLASLNEFRSVTAKYKLLNKLLQHIYKDECGHAGVDTSLNDGNNKMKATIPNTAFMNVIYKHLD